MRLLQVPVLQTCVPGRATGCVEALPKLWRFGDDLRDWGATAIHGKDDVLPLLGPWFCAGVLEAEGQAAAGAQAVGGTSWGLLLIS